MIEKLLSKLRNWLRWYRKPKTNKVPPPNLAKSLIEKDKPRKLKLLRFNYTRWRPQPKPLRYRSITKNHEVYKNILKEREKAEANK